MDVCWNKPAASKFFTLRDILTREACWEPSQRSLRTAVSLLRHCQRRRMPRLGHGWRTTLVTRVASFPRCTNSHSCHPRDGFHDGRQLKVKSQYLALIEDLPPG